MPSALFKRPGTREHGKRDSIRVQKSAAGLRFSESILLYQAFVTRCSRTSTMVLREGTGMSSVRA